MAACTDLNTDELSPRSEDDSRTKAHRLDAPCKVSAARPSLLDRLGLPDQLECYLYQVLASMKPTHQAVFIDAISWPDIEHEITVAAVTDTHTLNGGIRAALALCTLDLNRNEASLTRLACLISDLGSLKTSAGTVSVDHAMHGADDRRAHTATATLLRSVLGRFAEREPGDAVALEGLLGTEAHRPFRIGSKQGGPFSDHPADPMLARMGCAMGDALSQVRANLSREVRGREVQAQPESAKEGDERPEDQR